MRQRLFEYLLERPDGATAAELVGLVFTAPGGDPSLAARLVDGLLADDTRFAFDGADGRWHARRRDVGGRRLADVEFAVVDVETSGGGPGSGEVIELGAVRVAGGRCTGEFSSLVRPGRPIDPFVAGLTGITDAMVADAPPMRDVLPRFLAFAGDAVLVAHNARFDAGHLARHHLRLLGRPLGARFLCTIRLARRLLPELKRTSLDHLAAHLGVACPERHRALADARATAEILCILLERAAARGIGSVDALLAFERAVVDHADVVLRAPAAVAVAPSAPGVYHLLGDDDRLLYVGKAARLRERLQGWFADARGRSRRQVDMLRQVRDVRWTGTGSALAAALLEARHIAELRPPFNRVARQLPRVAFVKLGVHQAFPRVWTTRRLGTDRALYLGPFATRDAADRACRALAARFGLRTCAGRLAPSAGTTPCRDGVDGRCTAPCAARIDATAYDARVAAALRFVHDADAGTDASLLLDDVRRRRSHLGWVVRRQNFAVLLPTADRAGAQLYVVLGGRLAFDARVAAAADLLAAVRCVRERWERWQDAPLGRGDVVTSTILAAWLEDREREGILLRLDGPDALADRLDELTVTLRDLGQRGPLPAIDGLA